MAYWERPTLIRSKLRKSQGQAQYPNERHGQLGFDVPEVNLYAGAAGWVCPYSPCEQWVVPAPNSQFENEFNLKTVLDWNRSRIGRFKCFMWRKWTVWSLCEVYVKSSHIGQKWSRWFHWSFYFVNAECKKRLTRLNVSKQKSDER